MRDHFYTPFLQLMLPDLFFNKIKCKIQQHGNDAEDHNGHQDPCKSECLASVNNQVSQAFSCTDKFSDDHAHKTETDINFLNVDASRKRSRQNNFGKSMEFCAVKCVDQFDLLRIYRDKAGVQT